MTNVNQIYNFLPSSPSKTGNSISRARIRERKDSSGEQREKKKTCLKKNAARVNKRGSTAPSRSSSRAFLQIHPVSTGEHVFIKEASNISRRKRHIAPRFLAYPSEARSRPQQIIPVSPRASFSSSSSSWLAFEKPFFSIIEPVVARASSPSRPRFRRRGSARPAQSLAPLEIYRGGRARAAECL